MTTLYYDPILDVHHRKSAALANVTSFYAAPQESDDARRLWDASCASAGYLGELRHPLPASRGAAASLLLAREWGCADLAARLEAAIESSFEPTWDHARGEFTWGMGLNEPHPRGQYNAFLAAAEAGGLGRWERLSAAPLAPCPLVTGVDFPRIALRQAEWQGETLCVEVAPLTEDPETTTTFRVEGVSPGGWQISGGLGARVDVDGDSLVVTVGQRTAAYQIALTEVGSNCQ